MRFTWCHQPPALQNKLITLPHRPLRSKCANANVVDSGNTVPGFLRKHRSRLKLNTAEWETWKSWNLEENDRISFSLSLSLWLLGEQPKEWPGLQAVKHVSFSMAASRFPTYGSNTQVPFPPSSKGVKNISVANIT